MKVWVIEYDHDEHAHGVEGIANSLEEALQRILSKPDGVDWNEPAQAMIGGAWILHGTWNDRFYTKPRFLTYRFTEHSLAANESNSTKEKP